MTKRSQDRLCAAYESKTRWNAEHEQIFRWSVHALAYGRDAAVRLAARDGREEWREVDLVARRETLSALPEMLTRWNPAFNVLQKMTNRNLRLNRLTRPWRKTIMLLLWDANCRSRRLAKAAASHYKLRGKRAEKFREEIEDRVRSSGVEIGSWNNPSLCNYCDYRMSKDD